MYRLKKIDIYASEIAEYLDKKLNGPDVVVNHPASSDDIMENSVIFFEEITSDFYKEIGNYINLFAVLPAKTDTTKVSENLCYVLSENPKIDFIKLVNEYFTEQVSCGIAETAKIDNKALVGRNVFIGHNVVIGPDVKIGENTQIFNNVVIKGNVTIGANSVIKDNSTIGSAGYNFVKDENGAHLTYPNIGKIIIGENVWIGSNSTIESPSFENTVIEDCVKIDDLVHVGYNCKIGLKSFITAGVIISRNVKIGDNSLILPNSSVSENIKIGNNSVVGLGSVVVSNIEEDSIYYGNPAKFYKKNIR